MNKNNLGKENSLYLQQHAANPVHWQPYSPDIFSIAKKENKLILFSIGYSSCHWCHVMEKQTFENEEAAQLMNAHFVCVKVDREERPDLDNLYMQAVQMMTGRGGWPLNCFTLPDGRPVYGGTYFPPDSWMNIIKALHKTFTESPETCLEYAEKMMKGLSVPGFGETMTEDNFSSILNGAVEKWKEMFDGVYGGLDYAPKFPMPDNYLFLLGYGLLNKDETLILHAILTSEMMCSGGIFDHLDGGFFRYSTDDQWNVPHFEKMLYDNAQLLSLLAAVASVKKESVAEKALHKTLYFLEHSFKTSVGYLSAFDADSQGTEGYYYTWDENELKELCGDRYPQFKSVFGIETTNMLEDNRYVLSKNHVANHSSNFPDEQLRLSMLSARNKRVHPAIDFKVIASWNALMLIGLCDSFAFHLRKDLLVSLAELLMQQVAKNNPACRINYNGTLSGPSFLDDVALTSLALLKSFFISGNKQFAKHSQELTEWAIAEFYDPESGFFYFTPKNEKTLIRKHEVDDNVIPSSNAVIAECLCLLGDLTGNRDYTEMAFGMCKKMTGRVNHYPPGFSRWCRVLSMFGNTFYYFVICGEKNTETSLTYKDSFLANAVRIHLTESADEWEMLNGKFAENRNELYICTREYCMPAFSDFHEALAFLGLNADSRKGNNE